MTENVKTVKRKFSVWKRFHLLAFCFNASDFYGASPSNVFNFEISTLSLQRGGSVVYHSELWGRGEEANALIYGLRTVKEKAPPGNGENFRFLKEKRMIFTSCDSLQNVKDFFSSFSKVFNSF